MKSNTIKKVDRHSPIPVYQQIASDIVSRISLEEWGIGDKLPSENDLTAEYEASRVTVRQALAQLEKDGFVDRQRGRGAFVKSNPVVVIQDLYLPQIGSKTQSDVTSSDIKLSLVTDANSQVLTRLNLEPGTPLVYLERLFKSKRRTIGINRAWFPADKVPRMAEMPLINSSITDTLQQRYHIDFGSVENYIESFSLDAALSHVLNTVSPSPALKISSVYTTDSGLPIEYAVTIWNGRDTQFHIMISSNK